MGKTMAATALAAGLVLTACSGGGDGSADAPTTTQPGGTTGAAQPGIPDVAVDYLARLADGSVTEIGTMVDLTADGSPAELYAMYQLANSRYGTAFPSTSEVQGDQVEQCVDQTDATGATTQECTLFGSFEVDGAGQLVTFSTDGSPIADRLRAGDPAGATDAGITARVMAAYVTSRGDLFVAVDVTNGSAGVAQVDDCGATYVGPDGRQVDQMCVSQQPRVQPGATTSIVYRVEQAALGGTLTITAATDERGAGTFYDAATLNVQVPA